MKVGNAIFKKYRLKRERLALFCKFLGQFILLEHEVFGKISTANRMGCWKFFFDMLQRLRNEENSDLQSGIWFGSVAPSPIITLPQSLMA